MDPQVQQALKRITKANRLIIAGMGALLLASLQASKSMQELAQEVEHGGWKEATPEEAEEVEGQIADMVATYASQVN